LIVLPFGSPSTRPDRAPMTAVLADMNGTPLLFSKDGVVGAN
jgi:hypothetical protein